MTNGERRRTVMVTGGASGIGFAATKAFLSNGDDVIIVDNDLDKLAAAAHRLDEFRGRYSCEPTDVTRERAIEALATRLRDSHSSLDVLVNNAAVVSMKGMDATAVDWLATLESNVVGPALCIKYMKDLLMKSSDASIVNVSSVTALVADDHDVVYSVSKSALLHMTRCLAVQMGKDGIRVNAVCPGPVWTESNERKLRTHLGIDRLAANSHPKLGRAGLLNRVADPAEIAASILFLASSEASFITGHHLTVDGGQSIAR